MSRRPTRPPRATKRFGALALCVGGVLLIVGYLCTEGSGIAHDLGVMAVGYGIGVTVIGAWIAMGGGPPRRS
ncbi:MAG: hypothetical protein ACR2NB_12260 [Solirubrobacteraceae bacterium]